MALYASIGGTIEITGATPLGAYIGAYAQSDSEITFNSAVTANADTGAYVLSGGEITFNNTVTTNANTVAYASRGGSQVIFDGGLTNTVNEDSEESPIIQALNGGSVYVNYSGDGVVHHAGAIVIDVSTAAIAGLNCGGAVLFCVFLV